MLAGIFTLLILISLSFAESEGHYLFKNHCLRCHAENSPKPIPYLKSKYKGNKDAVIQMAKRCPWGKGLSDMEIEVIAEWLSGGK